ncbi:hypothetical protein LXA43DRAFT_996327 [Ganoderma leucocontextum]|nr:hypothetical protein LXA43DRAFT_996327 [Ganoderma leucocontextum]
MSTDGAAADPIASKSMPRRAAAQKASILAAEQLESDDDDRTGAPFREPSTPRSLVKVTYGGKRKYKHSPPKPRPRSRAMSLVESSPNKLQTSSAGRGRSGARGRSGKSQKNGHTGSGSPSSTVENNSVGESDPEVIIIEDEPKPVVVIPRRNTVTGSGNQSAHVKEAKNHVSALKVPKKRPLSRSPSSGSASSLTPMSSPDVPFKPVDFPRPSIPVLAPRLARQFMRVQSQMQRPTVSEFKGQPLTQSKSLDNIFTLDSSESENESTDETDMGNLVWVSLNLEGNLADLDTGEDTMWWPAKVELPKPLMRVSLFGDPPGPKTVDVPNPSASNVRSVDLNGHIRFNENNYRPSRRKSVQLSPRKKRKMDLDVVWRDARNAMVSVHEGNDDDFPTSSSRYAPGPSRRNGDAKGKGKAKADPKGKGKAKASDSEMDVGEDVGFGLDFGIDLNFKVERRWRAPSPNPLLEIPGELILARESRSKTQYWPAKIIAYIKPTKPSQKPKYKVVFFDSVVKQIEPDWFWTTTDDEFTTCKLGESTENYGLDEDNDALQESNDAEDFTRPFAPEDEATLRAPSPLPPLPAPDPVEFENELSVAEQFEHVKPVLAAVLDDAYGPARARHDGFMRGGGAQKKVLDAVPLRGSLSAVDKEEVAFLVRSWAWRRERRLRMGLDVEYPRDKLYPPPARPEGGERPAGGGLVRKDDDGDGAHSELSNDDTELLPESEPEAPPSSFAPTENDTDDEKGVSASVGVFAPDHEVADLAPISVPEDAQNPSAMVVNPTTEQPSATENVSMPTTPAQTHDSETVAIVPDVEDERGFAGKGAATATAAATPATTARAGPPSPSPPPPLPTTGRRTFHDLDTVEKITYCNNVLLQEAILQLLLWRTGQRTALGLLDPQEEERLHTRAMEEGEKTDWVHDIIRMRQAMEKTMLPGSKGTANGSHAGGGTGTTRTGRTRRGA